MVGAVPSNFPFPPLGAVLWGTVAAAISAMGWSIGMYNLSGVICASTGPSFLVSGCPSELDVSVSRASSDSSFFALGDFSESDDSVLGLALKVLPLGGLGSVEVVAGSGVGSLTCPSPYSLGSRTRSPLVLVLPLFLET